MNNFIVQIISVIDSSFIIVGLGFVVWGGLEVIYQIVKAEIKKHYFGQIQKLETQNRGAFASKLNLGLEFFNAVDIINTLQAFSWDNFIKLLTLMAIRAILSFILNMEIISVKKILDKFKGSDLAKEEADANETEN